MQKDQQTIPTDKTRHASMGNVLWKSTCVIDMEHEFSGVSDVVVKSGTQTPTHRTEAMNVCVSK